MLKQILSRIPRKSSKSDSTDSPACLIPRAIEYVGTSGHSVAQKRPMSAVFPLNVVERIEPLVPFSDVPSTETMNLFISKLSLCCVDFDSRDLTKKQSHKDLKRLTLIELFDFVSANPPKFSEPAILAMCKMFSANLFRAFPPKHKPRLRGADHAADDDYDSEPSFDPCWSHLQLIYDLFLKFVASSSLETKLAKNHINHLFILKLIELFDSEDPRERDCLKAIVHRIYGKFMVHRTFIRKNISNVFYGFVLEIDQHNGIAELLEIFGSVITGFSLPLKEEHNMFLNRVLIPLHKTKSLGVYFQQLLYCITQFIEKDPKLASSVIRGLLKYWPVTNSQKEVMFLSELEEILDVINMAEFQKVMVPLFWRINCCINSFHFQVAERSLVLWNNDQIVNLIAHNRHSILPIILPALENNVQSHWNNTVLNLTLNVRKMLKDMDGELLTNCLAHYKEQQAGLVSAAKKQRETWGRLEHVASLRPKAGSTAVLVTPLATTTSI